MTSELSSTWMMSLASDGGMSSARFAHGNFVRANVRQCEFALADLQRERYFGGVTVAECHRDKSYPRAIGETCRSLRAV